MVRAQCGRCGKELEFNNVLEYGEQIKKSGPEIECDECIAKGGGPEND